MLEYWVRVKIFNPNILPFHYFMSKANQIPCCGYHSNVSHGKRDNVDFNNRMIHVTHTKNWEVGDIPMNETLTKVLKDVIGEIQRAILIYLLVTKKENHIQTSRAAFLMQ